MTTYIFEADIFVSRWTRERRLFELTEERIAGMLAGLDANTNDLGINASELADLLNSRGEIEVVIKLAGKNAAVKKLLAGIAVLAWTDQVPYSVAEVEECGMENEVFDSYIGAHTR